VDEDWFYFVSQQESLIGIDIKNSIQNVINGTMDNTCPTLPTMKIFAKNVANFTKVKDHFYLLSVSGMLTDMSTLKSRQMSKLMLGMYSGKYQQVFFSTINLLYMEKDIKRVMVTTHWGKSVRIYIFDLNLDLIQRLTIRNTGRH
jgi:hypothetical protein